MNSPVRKGALIGAVPGALVAIGFEMYATKYPIQFGTYSFFVAMLIRGPAITVWNIFGFSARDISPTAWRLFVSLVVGGDALIGLLIGAGIGWCRRPSDKN